MCSAVPHALESVAHFEAALHTFLGTLQCLTSAKSAGTAQCGSFAVRRGPQGVLYGLGIGLAMHAAPMYIAETCPPSARGALVSLKEAMIVGTPSANHSTST